MERQQQRVRPHEALQRASAAFAAVLQLTTNTKQCRAAEDTEDYT
jgi:hypothetical protein